MKPRGPETQCAIRFLFQIGFSNCSSAVPSRGFVAADLFSEHDVSTMSIAIIIASTVGRSATV